jgi:uncharacterized protein
MDANIFINLPANDLKKARDFYTKIGFTVKEDFSNDMALCLLFKGAGFMLVSEDFYRQICEREIADSSKASEVVVALSLDSRDAVDSMLADAKGAGASWSRDAAEEDGMYAASFRDPFGHQLAIHVMD